MDLYTPNAKHAWERHERLEDAAWTGIVTAGGCIAAVGASSQSKAQALASKIGATRDLADGSHRSQEERERCTLGMVFGSKMFKTFLLFSRLPFLGPDLWSLHKASE